MMKVQEDDGPVMVIKSEEGPGRHCSYREFEWFASIAMFSIGIVVFLTPRTIEFGAFRYLLLMGFQTSWIWPLFMAVGAIGCGALYLNGARPVYGPHIRAICCVARALLWCMMTLALLRLTEETGTLSIGIPAWGWATVFELRALHRALNDVGRS